VPAWIPADLLASYPDGPYAVYVYYPKTQREIRQRNHSLASAVAEADRQHAAGQRVHVSLDTCG
jgi:hypothetical protein